MSRIMQGALSLISYLLDTPVEKQGFIPGTAAHTSNKPRACGDTAVAAAPWPSERGHLA